MSHFILHAGDDNRLNVKANAVRLIEALSLDKSWDIEINRWTKPRTLDQNKALWGVAYKALREETGNDPEDLHDYFCGGYFGWVEVVLFGQLRRKPRRTTTHDENGKRDVIPTKDFADFYAFVQQRSAENGYYVPDPDPTWFMDKEQMAVAA